MPLTIADGYHRVCASYHVNEDADIPCLLVDHKVSTALPGFRLGPVASERKESATKESATEESVTEESVTGDTGASSGAPVAVR